MANGLIREWVAEGPVLEKLARTDEYKTIDTLHLNTRDIGEQLLQVIQTKIEIR